MDISPCDGNATCTDTEGSFLCVCNSGYSGNGSSCASTYVELFVHKFSVKFPDIDECSTGGVCDENAECLDTPGSYMCTCHSGYTGDGDTCLDIDECLSDPCDKNATCTNNNGSFSCQCDSGFVGNGSICSGKVYSPIFVSLRHIILLSFADVDECSDGLNNCSINSTCTNTFGSYQCSCFTGYEDQGMGYECTGK